MLLLGIALLPCTVDGAEIAVDARQYAGSAWSPYVVGALLGVLSWLTFYFSDKPLGASSFYATVAGMLGKLVAKKHTEKLAYYKTNPPVLDWEFAFVLAAVGGAFLAAVTGGELTREWLPPMWEARFGEGPIDSTMQAIVFSATV